MIQIDKNIPVQKSKWQESKYPFNELEIGDSFLTTSARISALATYYNSKNPKKKFITRRVEDGFRVWRIK